MPPAIGRYAAKRFFRVTMNNTPIQRWTVIARSKYDFFVSCGTRCYAMASCQNYILVAARHDRCRAGIKFARIPIVQLAICAIPEYEYANLRYKIMEGVGSRSGGCTRSATRVDSDRMLTSKGV